MDEMNRAWRLLLLLTLYRIFLAAGFVVLMVSGMQPMPLASSNPDVFYYSSLAYLCISIASLYPLLHRRPHYLWQAYALTLIDILTIIAWMHSSGGVSSGVGMLLVISIANTSMISAGRISGFFAALASIAVLAEQMYNVAFGMGDRVNFSMAGLLGLTLFVTAILASVLANRARENEQLAHQRGIDLKNMSKLAEMVIQKMTTGVVLIDSQRQVVLTNWAARQLLGAHHQQTPIHLQYFSPELNVHFLRFQRTQPKNNKLLINNGVESLLMQVVRLDAFQEEDGQNHLLILEDANALAQQSQQIKLAALGRLTAGIAHEVRNPLSAISHANALLKESPDLSAQDLRLTEIVEQQTRRINRIVEDVLQLGKRDSVQAEHLRLREWLPHFLAEFYQVVPEAEPSFTLEPPKQEIEGWFDPAHLRQILHNLCQNAFRHASQAQDPAKVLIRFGHLTQHRGYIDVYNNGPSIDPDHIDRLFEPFFTMSPKGTGLGLYISRELAQANQGELQYRSDQDNGTCFRVVFNTALGKME